VEAIKCPTSIEYASHILVYNGTHQHQLLFEPVMILHLFPLIFWAILATLVVTPIAIRAAIRFQLIDHPNTSPHKIHQRPVPKAGGLAISFVILFINLLSGNLLSSTIRTILLAAIIIFLFGLWDDTHRLSPRWKLVGQVLATILLISQGVHIRMLGSLTMLNMALTLLWTIGITNAFNLVDSMDGLAIGLAAIASAFFMLVTVDAGQPSLSLLSAILLGCSIGMLYFNTLPAHTFLGDSGAQFLGFTLAALAIAYTPPGLPQPSSWFVPILLLSVPIFDTTLVVISRLRQKKAVYQAGLDHTYHRLINLGLPSSRAVLTMHLFAIVSGCLAFMALPLPPLWANAIFISALLVGMLLLFWLEKKESH
jgi:UDP-GlcNAc:undecaprenyl-phosphate/decaprenyl-phosphate GlcNAc-1-phosphate transferase